MIFKVLDADDLTVLYESLKFQLPGSSKIFYVVDRMVKGKCPGFEIITDNWPVWKCVIGRPQPDNAKFIIVEGNPAEPGRNNHPQVAGRPSFIRPDRKPAWARLQLTCAKLAIWTKFATVPEFLKSTYICHTNSTKALKYFIQRPGVINWSKPVILSGIPYDLTCTLKEVSKKNGGSLSNQNQCFMYAWQQKDPPPPPEVPKNLHLECLEPSQAKYLSKQWYSSGQTEAEKQSQKLMSMLLDNFESSCLMDSDGEVLAYAWLQNYGSMGGLFVKPDHRRKGYGIMVMQDLTRKVMEKGHVPYVYTVTNDTPAINMMQKLGFRWVPSGDTTWVQHTPTSMLLPDGRPKVELPLI